MYIYICTYMYIYIHKEREREREREIHTNKKLQWHVQVNNLHDVTAICHTKNCQTNNMLGNIPKSR